MRRSLLLALPVLLLNGWLTTAAHGAPVLVVYVDSAVLYSSPQSHSDFFQFLASANHLHSFFHTLYPSQGIDWSAVPPVPIVNAGNLSPKRQTQFLKQQSSKL